MLPEIKYFIRVFQDSREIKDTEVWREEEREEERRGENEPELVKEIKKDLFLGSGSCGFGGC